jgi:raffinose/stachyose/melibiose transport system substrate-binding protein
VIAGQGRRRGRAVWPALAGAGAAALVVTACSSGSDGQAGGEAVKEFSYLTNVENTTIRTALETVAGGECADAQQGLPLKVETVPPTRR